MTTTSPITKQLTEYPVGAKAWRGWEPKRNGELRPIAKPNKVLLKWLQTTNGVLAASFGAWPPFMHGGIKKRSYVTYARPHVGKQCVITIDVRKCFDTITTQQVATCLKKHLTLDSETANNLAERLTFKGKVAQGFPTSNFICNLYLLEALTELHAAFAEQTLVLTNYVDDIAVSGDIIDAGVVINQVAKRLSRNGLAINKNRGKICIMPASRRQVICGLLVNRKLTLTKAKKLELYSSVARGTMSSASAQGWIANLKTVDPVFGAKLYAFAVKKNVLK